MKLLSNSPGIIIQQGQYPLAAVGGDDEADMVYLLQSPADFRVVEGRGVWVAVAAEGVDDAAIQFFDRR